MNIDFEKLQGICPHRWNRHTNDGSFKICEVQDKICSESNCPLKASDISVVMANDAVRNMHTVKAVDIVSTTAHGNADHLYEGMTCATRTHIVTDNSETLKNALARIGELEKKKSRYCNCRVINVRIDHVPTCAVCNKPIVVEEG